MRNRKLENFYEDNYAKPPQEKQVTEAFAGGAPMFLPDLGDKPKSPAAKPDLPKIDGPQPGTTSKRVRIDLYKGVPTITFKDLGIELIVANWDNIQEYDDNNVPIPEADVHEPGETIKLADPSNEFDIAQAINYPLKEADNDEELSI